LVVDVGGGRLDRDRLVGCDFRHGEWQVDGQSSCVVRDPAALCDVHAELGLAEAVRLHVHLLDGILVAELVGFVAGPGLKPVLAVGRPSHSLPGHRCAEDVPHLHRGIDALSVDV